MAALLSRLQFTTANYIDHFHVLPEPIWIPTHLDLTPLNYSICIFIVGDVELVTSVADKLLSGFRPSTLSQCWRTWMDFMAFQVTAVLLPHQVTVQLLLSLLECVHQNGIAHTQLQNYLTVIKASYIIHGLDTATFRVERLRLFLKALKLQVPFKPRILAHLDVPLLEQIIKQLEHFVVPVVFRPLYLVMFFFISHIVQCLTTLYCKI